MSLRWLLLESRFTLAAVLVVVCFVVIWIWQRRRTRMTGRLAGACVVLSPLLLLLSVAIVTDRERIAAVCREMAVAVGSSKIDQVGQHISRSFQTASRNGMLDRDDFLDVVRSALKRWDVEEERLSDFEIETRGDRATVSFRATCRLVGPELMLPRHVSVWDLEFSREGSGWKVVDVQPRRTAMMPVDSLGDLLR